jgi:ribosomal protein L37E
MTTYTRKEVTCANCGAQSSHATLGSTNEFGSPDLDLRPPQMMRATMNAWLQECPACGLVALSAVRAYETEKGF